MNNFEKHLKFSAVYQVNIVMIKHKMYKFCAMFTFASSTQGAYLKSMKLYSYISE